MRISICLLRGCKIGIRIFDLRSKLWIEMCWWSMVVFSVVVLETDSHTLWSSRYENYLKNKIKGFIKSYLNNTLLLLFCSYLVVKVYDLSFHAYQTVYLYWYILLISSSTVVENAVCTEVLFFLMCGGQKKALFCIVLIYAFSSFFRPFNCLVIVITLCRSAVVTWIVCASWRVPWLGWPLVSKRCVLPFNI